MQIFTKPNLSPWFSPRKESLTRAVPPSFPGSSWEGATEHFPARRRAPGKERHGELLARFPGEVFLQVRAGEALR